MDFQLAQNINAAQVSSEREQWEIKHRDEMKQRAKSLRAEARQLDIEASRLEVIVAITES